MASDTRMGHEAAALSDPDASARLDPKALAPGWETYFEWCARVGKLAQGAPERLSASRSRQGTRFSRLVRSQALRARSLLGLPPERDAVADRATALAEGGARLQALGQAGRAEASLAQALEIARLRMEDEKGALRAFWPIASLLIRDASVSAQLSAGVRAGEIPPPLIKACWDAIEGAVEVGVGSWGDEWATRYAGNGVALGDLLTDLCSLRLWRAYSVEPPVGPQVFNEDADLAARQALWPLLAREDRDAGHWDSAWRSEKMREGCVTALPRLMRACPPALGALASASGRVWVQAHERIARPEPDLTMTEPPLPQYLIHCAIHGLGAISALFPTPELQARSVSAAFEQLDLAHGDPGWRPFHINGAALGSKADKLYKQACQSLGRLESLIEIGAISEGMASAPPAVAAPFRGPRI